MYTMSSRLVTLADVCRSLLFTRNRQFRNARSLEPAKHIMVACRPVVGSVVPPLSSTVAEIGTQCRHTAFFSQPAALPGRPWDITLAFAVLDLLVISPLALIWNGLHRYSNDSPPPGKMLLLLRTLTLPAQWVFCFADVNPSPAG